MTFSFPHALSSKSADLIVDEFAKDIWDARNLPGIQYARHRSDHLLNFTLISPLFRAVVKRYIKFLITHRGQSACRRALGYIRQFLDFFVSAHPAASTFQEVNRADIESYLVYLRALKGKPNAFGVIRGEEHVWRSVQVLKQFFEYLERTSSPEAPDLPVGRLIWPTDSGKCPTKQKRPEKIKYLPEEVLDQLEQNMHLLSAQYLPTVMILRASGWRIGDVLNLRYDSCLEQASGGWWLCGDILKTEVLGHRVPLSEEIAALVTAQCEVAKSCLTEEDNPEHYLFPSIQACRKGRPIYKKGVRRALDRLAQKCGIRDTAGNIFHFRTHAFRHTKAVELINAGMSLVLVQKWLAHLSPEMTLAYARILDTTMRKEWEQAFAKGAVRIDPEGQPKVVSTEQLGNEQEIEWEYIRRNLDAVRLADGYCFKPKKATCPTQDSPCYTCRHFCTTPDFLPQFDKQERELHELIELGEKAGSEIWVERNTQKLNRVLPLIQVLRKGDLHHPAGKTIREYTPAERAQRT